MPKLVYTTDPVLARKLREDGEMPEARDLAPAEQTIRVAIDRKRRKGKSVTAASGFRLTPASLEKLARQLKARCAAGGSTKQGEIEVQGEHVDVIGEALASLGYRVKKG
ncbi:MAG: translation initiation factor [Thermoanaerobaculia bacterium]|jgi:translation initiation factor 1